MNIDKFKQEHVYVMNSVGTLRELVQAGVTDHAEEIVAQLLAMTGAIKLHLAAEDRVLYPALANAPDPLVAQTSRMFQQEMGGLAETLTGFVSRWNLAAKISQNPQGFRDEANAVFKALHMRVQRENRELYPMAEAI
ncbi:hemerythrin domain-containing protein [Dyella dinghuensis]|uniref:Hemerythrin domain-containing protein n=1 Tax=Dyella dinghuensis TaxID=1920169 RepID=A0A3S0RW65_9GAMM|nr:hemerythrin domain-containing protein [Dyella dinghuensis]RUL67047.1 hemerythrin domain-containing protein [Dyella dinghuensis]